jgi:hypothetical protein
MAEYIIQSEDLFSDVLTHKMPLSDAFYKANAGLNKSGVQWGFQLDYKDRIGLKITNTDYLTIKKGKATIAVEGTVDNKAEGNVLVTVGLSVDVDVLITGYAPSTMHYVYLYVDYVPSTVSESSGLVLNDGTNSARILIKDGALEDDNMMNHVLIGKFTVSTGHVETAQQMVKDEAGSNLKNGSAALFEYDKDAFFDSGSAMSQLGKFKEMVCIDNFTNLHKRVKIKNARDATGIATPAVILGTDQVFFDYSATKDTNYGGTVASKGIWNDVEVMEFENCRFASNVILGFHRTPGNNKYYVDAAGTSIQDNQKDLTTYIDRGAQRFVLDGGKSGLRINGNLTIELALDFVGHIYDFVYNIVLKNIQVEGNLYLNIGCSRIYYRNGKFGAVKYENVLVKGDSYLNFKPYGDDSGAVRNTAWDEDIGPFQEGASNAGGTRHGGPGYGPVDSSYLATGAVVSEGILVLYNHFNDAAGTIFLYEKENGALTFINSTEPNYILEDSFDEDKNTGSSNYFDKRRLVKVKMLGCDKYASWTQGIQTRTRHLRRVDVLTTLYELYALDHRNTTDWGIGSADYLAKKMTTLNRDKSLAFNFQLGGFPKREIVATFGSVNTTLLNGIYYWTLNITTADADLVTWLIETLRQSKVRNTLAPSAPVIFDKADWVWFGADEGAALPWELSEVEQVDATSIKLIVIGNGGAPASLDYMAIGSWEEFGDAHYFTTPVARVRNACIQNEMEVESLIAQIIKGVPGVAGPLFEDGARITGILLSVADNAGIVGVWDCTSGELHSPTIESSTIKGVTDMIAGSSTALEGTLTVLGTGKIFVISNGVLEIYNNGKLKIGSTEVTGTNAEKLINVDNADSLHVHAINFWSPALAIMTWDNANSRADYLHKIGILFVDQRTVTKIAGGTFVTVPIAQFSFYKKAAITKISYSFDLRMGYLNNDNEVTIAVEDENSNSISVVKNGSDCAAIDTWYNFSGDLSLAGMTVDDLLYVVASLSCSANALMDTEEVQIRNLKLVASA